MKINYPFRVFSIDATKTFTVLLVLIALMSFNESAAQILSYTTAPSGALNSVAANAFGDSLTRIGCVATGSSCTTGFTSNTFSDSTTFTLTRTAVQTWVAPDAGYTLNVDSFSANMRRSASGPDSAVYAYSTDGGNTWATQGDYAIPSVSCGAGTTFAWAAAVTVNYPDTLMFRIYAFHASTTGGTEQILNLTIGGTVTANSSGGSCGTPANLAASNITDSTATLNWAAVAGALSYNIQYSVSGANNWSSTISSTNTVNISGLSASQSYQFEVQAVCSGDSSGSFSNLAGFNTASADSGGSSGSCDTTINIAITDTLHLYPYPGKTGYISGNNGYGDLAKAEEFTSTAGNEVTGAILNFAYVTILSTDSAKNIAVNVWNSNGGGGHPGTILATDSITLESIAQAVTNHSLLYVHFTNPPVLTDTNFYIGIMLPTTTGDTVALYTNLETSNDGRGWELWKGGAWHPYDTAYNLSPHKMGNYIAAIVCPIAPGSCGTASNLSASHVTDSSAMLSWSVVPGATSYNIQYRISGSGSWTTGASTSDSLSISGLTGGETYQFQVQAVCSDSIKGNFSSPSNFITAPAPGGCGVPANLSASAITDSSATLNWDSVPGALIYNIEYRQLGTGTWSTDTSVTNSANISGLTAAQNYQFQVQAVCSNGVGNYSAPVTFNTTGGCIAPINLSASAITDSSATLKWGAVAGATGYNIQYHLLGASGWSAATSATDSLSVSGLTAGITYIFEVQTVCTGGTTGSFSDSVVFTTFPASSNGGSCDTISNLSPNDSITYYPYGGTTAGYISGNNGYGDLAKAEELTSVAGNQITGALLRFAFATVLSTDSATTVAVNVWDDTGPGGHPGTILASNTLTLGAIANSIATQSVLYVPFTSPPTLVDTNFYIGVMLPTTVGDTIVLFTNLKTSGDGQGWELWKTGVWHPYDSSYHTLPDHFGNYIEAISCSPAPPMPPVAAFTASPTSGCASLTVNFTDQSTNAPTSWNWTFTGGSPATSTQQSPSVLYATAGTYSATLVAGNSAGSNSVTQTNLITVYPGPTVTVQTTPATGQTIADGSATATGAGGTPSYTYTWNNSESGATDMNMAPGTYSVTLTDANSCTAVDANVLITYPTGIAEINAGGQLKIYPNPANDILHVEWTGNSEIELQIVDLTGKAVKSFVTNASINLNVADLAAGPYIIYIKDTQTQTQQAVKFAKL